MVLRSCQHIDVLWSWPNLPGLRLVIMLLVLRTSESAGRWAMAGNQFQLNYRVRQSPSEALAGFWWVICPERDLFDQWPHLIMCPLRPFIKVTTTNGVASNIYIKPGLQVASKNRNYYFALQFCKHVKAKVWERNECANEYFCWNIHNKVLFAWT